jgi:hypothetical protein
LENLIISDGTRLQAPDGARPRFTVHDVAAATGKSENEVRRILKVVGVAKNYDHGTVWGFGVFDFPAICRRVRHFGCLSDDFNNVA